MEKIIYVGKAKIRQTRYGDIVAINICLSDIPEEHTRESKGKVYTNLNVVEMRNPDGRGNTHTVTVNTWKPSGGGNQGVSKAATKSKETGYKYSGPEDFDDDIPF